MRFVDQFTVVLLDMNGTFMFGQDRLGPDEDYFATYRALGGQRLDSARVRQVIDRTCAGLFRVYEDPARFDDFPSIAEALRDDEALEPSDLALLEAVIAAHEIGYIPPNHQSFLRDLARTHQLGVVSNIWSRPEPWLQVFREAGLGRCFQSVVFSSEGRSIKPSRVLFERALRAFPSDARVLFVGDSLRLDILPAKALGLATVWLAPAGSTHNAADLVLSSLTELAGALT